MGPRKGLLAAALLAAASGAFAAEASYDFVVCTHGRQSMLETGPALVAFGVEQWGVVSSSATKEWEQATSHCMGYLRIVGGRPVGKGTCKWTQAGGDTAVGEFEYVAAGPASWTWLSGTGKLAGISGSGTFQELFAAKTGVPGISAGCRRDWGRYAIP